MTEDNITKRITIILSGKDDGATATMDKSIAKANELERTFKKIGKITGIGGFRTASDVAEGFGGELGAIGRYAGITAGVGGALTIVNKVSAAADNAVAKLQSGEIAFEEFTNEFVKGIPIIGSIQKGLQDTVEIITGTKAMMRAVQAEASQIDAQIEERKQRREYVFDIIRQANNERDPAAKIRKQLEVDLDYLKQIRDAKEIDEDRYQYARQFKAKQAEDAIAKIAIEANEKRLESFRITEDLIGKAAKETADLRFEADQRSLRASGKIVTADIAELKRKAEAEIKAINEKINESASNPNIEQNDAMRISRALQEQAGVVTRDAEQRAKDAIDRQIKITQDEVNSRRSEQARLQREQEDAGRLTSFETQQRARTSTMDGRGVTGFFNQSKSIEDSGRKTADNTKATADAVKAVSSTLDKLFTGGAFISL